MIDQFFVKKHTTSASILLFIVVFYLVQLYKPGFLYNKDGSIRQFGLGYKKKTVIPLWLVAVILSIFSYLTVRYVFVYRSKLI